MADNDQAVAVVADSYLATQDNEDMLEILQENLGGQAIDPTLLTQVKVPGGEQQSWIVPSIDGDQLTDAIEGVVVLWQTQRMRWSSGDPDGTPPLCASRDGMIGRGDNLDELDMDGREVEIRYSPDGEEQKVGRHDCSVCPLAQLGTAENGRAAACTEKRVLYVRTPGSILPMAVNVPPTSVKEYTKYSLRLAASGIVFWGCVTSMTLEGTKNKDSKPYNVIKFGRARAFNDGEREAMTEYRAAMVPVLENTLLVDGATVDAPAAAVDLGEFDESGGDADNAVE